MPYALLNVREQSMLMQKLNNTKTYAFGQTWMTTMAAGKHPAEKLFA